MRGGLNALDDDCLWPTQRLRYNAVSALKQNHVLRAEAGHG